MKSLDITLLLASEVVSVRLYGACSFSKLVVCLVASVFTFEANGLELNSQHGESDSVAISSEMEPVRIFSTRLVNFKIYAG